LCFFTAGTRGRRRKTAPQAAAGPLRLPPVIETSSLNELGLGNPLSDEDLEAFDQTVSLPPVPEMVIPVRPVSTETDSMKPEPEDGIEDSVAEASMATALPYQVIEHSYSFVDQPAPSAADQQSALSQTVGEHPEVSRTSGRKSAADDDEHDGSVSV